MMDGWKVFITAIDWAGRIQTIIKVLIALGLGNLLKGILTTQMPKNWLTPFWLLSSAAILALISWISPKMFRKKTKPIAEASPSLNVPLEDQIYIHIPAVATAVIGDQASTKVSFFSAQNLRLTYCKVKFARGEASFTLENAQPMNIEAFHAAEQNLQRSLTTDEQERIGQTGRGHILHYEGLAIFGHIEKPFWGMVVEHL